MQGKTYFFQGPEGKRQWISRHFNEILNSISTSVKSQGILPVTSRCFCKAFPFGKGNLISKTVFEGIDFCGFIAKDLS